MRLIFIWTCIWKSIQFKSIAEIKKTKYLIYVHIESLRKHSVQFFFRFFLEGDQTVSQWKRYIPLKKSWLLRKQNKNKYERRKKMFRRSKRNAVIGFAILVFLLTILWIENIRMNNRFVDEHQAARQKYGTIAHFKANNTFNLKKVGFE